MPQVVNVDILDDRDPIILVQQYIFDDRTLLVFRKPTDEDGGMFTLSPGVEIDRSLNWGIDTILEDTSEDLMSDEEEPDESLLEVVAVIYRAEDNPPWHADDPAPNAMPYAYIVYNPKTANYCCQGTFQGYDELDTIAEPSFKATLYFAVDALHDALARHGE